MGNAKQRVVVVTGGAAGIGAAIAEELGRIGAFVVTLDPVVSVDGSSALESSERTTAEKIVDAGGAARASNTSVTDQEAVPALFAELVEEFGSLDAVVNVAGISRRTDFASGTEEDWSAVLDVHLEGYLNVLNAALPIMAKAGHGQILGVTSGSGWRPANVGAYGCAKRAVAALTWQIGRTTPPGVTVNALSPIAATRMVAGGLAARPPSGAAGGSTTDTGGLNLGSMPPPENLGPIGAYLASEEFASWCEGQVIFSGGSELAWLAPPRLLEVARSADVTSLSHALETVMPVAFATAEAAQATNGGSNPRFGPVFEEPSAVSAGVSDQGRSCVLVTDDDAWASALDGALTSQGVKTVRVAEPAQGFAAAADQLSRAVDENGPIDAVVVALRGTDGGGGVTTAGGWRQVLDEHAGIAENVRTDAAWVRAVSDCSAQAERPVRVVTITNATSFGGRSRSQSAAQLARAAHMASADKIDAFAISVETAAEAGRQSLAALAAYLVSSPDSAALSGAELVVASDWFGLRSHPTPAATISYGGPAVPDWVDGTLRTIVTGIPS
jgi:NAD(P)-dependent dehydrogenase (short-subunit alcohol dehydrogenase family)